MSQWHSIGVVMITYNAEATLEVALQSIPAGAEIIVSDGGSDDRTVAIAKSFKARVIQQDSALVAACGGNFDVARNRAMGLLTRQWVFILDSDEKVTEGLAREIAATIDRGEEHAAYDIPRKNFYWAKEVRLLGEDRQIRLLRKGNGQYGGNRLHCPICVDGSIGQLQEWLIHLNITSWTDVRRMFRRLQVERRNRTSSITATSAIRHTLHMFRYYIIRQQAWRDGLMGVFVSGMYSIYHGLSSWPGRK